MFANFKILVPSYSERQRNGYRITYRELWLSFPQGLAYHLRCECLVWASHHEYARFDVNDPIHPATKIVWFQIRNAVDVLLVSIYERTSAGWVHISMGVN